MEVRSRTRSCVDVSEAMNPEIPVYIGYDPREEDAYAVCESSLLAHSTVPPRIVKLERSELAMFDRPFRMNGAQMIDMKDGRPFSTEFSFTRFLVPALSGFKGYAIFCDSDFLFTDDIANVFAVIDPKAAVHVVKHNQHISEKTKMDGVSQSAYMRKNWSSFVVWNCGHPSNKYLTSEVVNNQSGRWLHGFWWLADSEIAELPLTWNYLADVSRPWTESQPPKAVHYTLGTPSMKGYENCQFADLWKTELARIRHAGSPGNITIAA